MNYIYACNTSSDCLSKVNTDNFKEEKKIYLGSDKLQRIGPHGITNYSNVILTANNYSNSISKIDGEKDIEIGNYYIGMHCNDVAVLNKKAYIICGECNNVVIFDLMKNSISEEIPCGNLPHSITLNKEKKIILITNMQSDSLTIIDSIDKGCIKEIRVGAYPTKAVFTVDGQYILVCESNIGSYYRGTIGIIHLKSLRMISRVIVGNSPVDMFCDERYCYVSNFGDGTISIVDINNSKEVRKINVGGMPRGIVKFCEHIYVGDNYNNTLMKVNIKNECKKIISIGGEPTGIMLISH